MRKLEKGRTAGRSVGVSSEQWAVETHDSRSLLWHISCANGKQRLSDIVSKRKSPMSFAFFVVVVVDVVTAVVSYSFPLHAHRTNTKTNQNDGKIWYSIHTHTQIDKFRCAVLCTSKYCGHYFFLFFFAFLFAFVHADSIHAHTTSPQRMHHFILSAYDFCGHFHVPCHAMPVPVSVPVLWRMEWKDESESVAEKKYWRSVVWFLSEAMRSDYILYIHICTFCECAATRRT